MGHSTNKSIKFSKEELELIERAVQHYNKFVKMGNTDQSKLIRVASLDMARKILSSQKITIKFEEK